MKTPIAQTAIDGDDMLTSVEEQIVRRGEAEFKRGESKSWRAVKDALSLRHPEGPATIIKVDQRLIIPTLRRAKIARNLSYPVGAEQISAALAAAPQFAELRLYFSYEYQWHGYEFIRAQYSIGGRRLAAGPMLPTFEICVRPVPRTSRHRVKEYIVETALPQIAQWLVERATLKQHGTDHLAFSFNEAEEEFLRSSLTRLEPVRSVAH